jgi:hypothetical protein
MWDDELKACFFSSRFDYVVDAEEVLVSREPVETSSEKKQEGDKRTV